MCDSDPSLASLNSLHDAFDKTFVCVSIVFIWMNWNYITSFWFGFFCTQISSQNSYIIALSRLLICTVSICTVSFNHILFLRCFFYSLLVIRFVLPFHTLSYWLHLEPFEKSPHKNVQKFKCENKFTIIWSTERCIDKFEIELLENVCSSKIWFKFL